MPWPQKPWYAYIPRERNPPAINPCKACYHAKIEHYKIVEKVKGRKRHACALCIREADYGCAAGIPKKKLRKKLKASRVLQ